MVQTLLKFIYASRAQNWRMHLSAVKDMLHTIVSMDHIKYRRMLPVYLADMVNIETSDPSLWEMFNSGHFCIQKSRIPFTALGRDHAGEQMNKRLKIEGGIKGITHNENARTIYFVIAKILKVIVQEVKIIGSVNTRKYMKHRHLNERARRSQSEKELSLISTLNDVKFHMGAVTNKRLYNIVSGRVFPENINMNILNVEKIGTESLNTFEKERLSRQQGRYIFSTEKNKFKGI